ncbi:MAG: lactonase family protein [Lachnospiraceae bacterium]|nr:lactonase family protein [Lachnospiraceae bacterium]
MAEKEAYVAYAGTYTNGTSKGIHIYDVDVEEGLLHLRKVVPVNNSSYITRSKNMKYLYSIADEGVRAYRIMPDGDLHAINEIDINGMRGCHMSVDKNGKYLFVAGYHDGKVTVVHTHQDGRLGNLMDGVFHKGIGAVNERSFRPHVCCVRVTPDNRFLCAVDNGIDQVVIYQINHTYNKLQKVDILRMGREAGPRSIHFSRNGKQAYILCEITNVVRVYDYKVVNNYPVFELKQELSTLSDTKDPHDAASALRISNDGNYLFCSTAGDDSVACYRINPDNGLLTRLFSLPTAGTYPKDIAIFPDEKHIAVVNNGSGTITTFAVDYEKQTLVMKGKPKKLDTPNCMVFQKIEKAPDVIRDVPEAEAEAAAKALLRPNTPVSLETEEV